MNMTSFFFSPQNMTFALLPGEIVDIYLSSCDYSQSNHSILHISDRWYAEESRVSKFPPEQNEEPGVASLFIGLLKPCLSLQRTSRVWEVQHGCPYWFWCPSSLVPPQSCTWSTGTFQSFQSVLFFWFILNIQKCFILVGNEIAI